MNENKSIHDFVKHLVVNDTFYIIGVNITKGIYPPVTGNPYHNVNLKCIVPFNEKGDSVGDNIENVKIPVPSAIQLFGLDCTPDTITSSMFGHCINKTIRFGYNKFAVPVSYSFVDNKSEKGV